MLRRQTRRWLRVWRRMGTFNMLFLRRPAMPRRNASQFWRRLQCPRSRAAAVLYECFQRQWLETQSKSSKWS